MVTVRLCAVPPVVFNCATAAVLLMTVAVRLPPGRTYWNEFSVVLVAFGRPTVI